MKFTIRKRRQPPAVIIVPLIDILLVLLIFLMITSTFKQQPAIRLSLPKSSSGESETSDLDFLLVTVARESPYFYLGPQPVTFEKLKETLLAAAKEDPAQRLSIAADEGAPFGQVIRVLDVADQAKFKNVNAFTRKAE